MSILFLDTSALIKRYLTEKGSTWMAAQCQPSAGHALVIAQVTLVEAVATFCRKARETDPAQRITLKERNRLIAFFRKYVNAQYDIITVTTSLYIKAGDLCRIHPLRAYDAVQLACALTARNQLTDSGQPAPIFVSADDKLLEIARAEGFAVENPNKYQ
jgi:uncharacterized protein